MRSEKANGQAQYLLCLPSRSNAEGLVGHGGDAGGVTTVFESHGKPTRNANIMGNPTLQNV